MRASYFGQQIPLVQKDMLTAEEMIELRAITDLIDEGMEKHPTWRSGTKRHHFNKCLRHCQ
jgi:hypothetical protein